MRVLFITELAPASDTAEITGGVEARLHYVSRELRGRHHVEVIADHTTGSRWEAASVGSIPRRAWFLATALVRGLTRSFDVVDGSNLVVFPVAWLVAKLRRRPVVFWYPDVLIGRWRQGDFGVAGWLGETIERAVLKLPVDRYIAISHATARKLVAHGVKPDHVTVVPCGYDPAAVTRALESSGASAEPRVTVVGRLVNYKRVDVVVRALGHLRDRHPELRLDIIGQGPEEARLAALAADLGLADRVTFTGHVTAHVDVLRHIARSRLFVSASEIEGFGIVVVEAMALGVPYVVADNDAFREITGGGIGGALFRGGDAHDLAERMHALLSDPDRHRAAAVAGAAFATRYRWDDIAAATEQVFDNVVSARRRPV